MITAEDVIDLLNERAIDFQDKKSLELEQMLWCRFNSEGDRLRMESCQRNALKYDASIDELCFLVNEIQSKMQELPPETVVIGGRTIDVDSDEYQAAKAVADSMIGKE